MQLRFTQSYRSHLDDTHTLNILCCSKEKEIKLLQVNEQAGEISALQRRYRVWPKNKSMGDKSTKSWRSSHKAEAQKHKILSGTSRYHLIHTKPSRHQIAPTEKGARDIYWELLRERDSVKSVHLLRKQHFQRNTAHRWLLQMCVLSIHLCIVWRREQCPKASVSVSQKTQHF